MILVGAGGGSFSRPPGRSAVSCMTTLNPASGTRPSGRLRLVLVLVALIETVSTLSNLPVLYFGAPDVPGTSPGGLLISATILLSPLFAIAALVYAAKGNIRRSIIALAAVVLLGWLSYVPSAAKFWSEFPGPGFGGVVSILVLVIFPLLGIAAIILAQRGDKLGLATGLVILPTLLHVLAVVAFGVSVAIYGF